MRWRTGPQNEVNVNNNTDDDMKEELEALKSEVDAIVSDAAAAAAAATGAGDISSSVASPTKEQLGRAAKKGVSPGGFSSGSASVSSIAKKNGVSALKRAPLGTTSKSTTKLSKKRAADAMEGGSDHADADETDQPSWKPQTAQSTCEFTHTITNYAQKRESGCKKAEYSATTVDSEGNRWRLIVYVNGNGRASNHHLSLFLQVADADELPFGWKKAVSYVLTLEHPSGGNLGYAKRNPDKTFKLCPKAIDWGWSQFITSDRIQQEGYVANDSLTVRASVTVKSSSVHIDPEDSELYLKCAVEEGNAPAVKDCLKQGAGVNCQFKDDLYTPLHTACSSSASTGSLEVLNLLLEMGADGNACNKWRETPLLIAANNGHRTAVEALLKKGANPSLCSEAGWSALTFAAHKGYDDIVSLLLTAGAPVNCEVTEDLSTPLHKACAGGKKGHLSAVKQLLGAGADVHALNKWRETPLLTAANHGQASAVDALLKAGADPGKCTDTGWSPLSIAAYKGHDDVVRLLLEEGAPTEEADPTLSALLQAATKGLPDTVELLLRHGADHTVTTKKGDTALSILVEQNLIDAAVEMVTEYKASIPRCSRDRKKVQRARLLINLRVKKQQRDGLLNVSTDDETDEESEESNKALHSGAGDDGGPNAAPPIANGKKNKKKSKKTSVADAEAQARAAEEALLLELAEEENRAQKDVAAANSKRAKNKKKKERQRQQKLKEEREREEREEAEREKQRKLEAQREEKARQRRRQLQREAEEREKAEKEEVARSEAERRQREASEKREREKLQRTAVTASKAVSSPTRSRTNGKGKGKKQQTQAVSPPQPSPAPKANRGWEKPSLARVAPAPPPNPVVSAEGNSSNTYEAKKMQKPVTNGKTQAIQTVHKNGVNAGARSAPETLSITPPSTPQGSVSTLSEPASDAGSAAHAELPAVSLYRQEKLAELVRLCAVARTHPESDPLGVVNEAMIQNVIYRWMVRAGHDKSTYMDPMIPSWTDESMLTSFLQRQFIAESRKGNGSRSMVGMEALKEAGSSFATLCMAMANDVVKFKEKRLEELPIDWSDATLGITASEVRKNGMGSMVVIDWSNRVHVELPALVYTNMRRRYTGPTSRLLSALFVAKKRYEVARMLVIGTALDCQPLTGTQESLGRNAAVSVELWTNPFNAYGEHAIFGMFPDVDSPFGAIAPFASEDVGRELSLFHRGVSVSVMLPFDNMVASMYVRRIVDLMEAGDNQSVPLSFVVFLPSECFRDPTRPPEINDLALLEPRLGDRHGTYVRCAEILPEDQHAFAKGDGKPNISRSRSLFVLFQNEAGKATFPLSDQSLIEIIRSMNIHGTSANNGASSSMPVYSDGYTDAAIISSYSQPIPTQSPRAATMNHPTPEFGTIGGDPLPLDRQTSSKQSRLFELIDDGEDVQDVDVVSNMLNNISVFENGPTQEVDIEAIGIFGIGGTSLDTTMGGFGASHAAGGRFG